MNIFQRGESEGLYDALFKDRQIKYEHRMCIQSLTNE